MRSQTFGVPGRMIFLLRRTKVGYRNSALKRSGFVEPAHRHISVTSLPLACPMQAASDFAPFHQLTLSPVLDIISTIHQTTFSLSILGDLEIQVKHSGP